MSQIKIPTSFNIELEFEAASLARRFAAWFLDLMVQGAYLLVAFRLLGMYLSGTQDAADDVENTYNVTAVQMLISLPVLLYHLLSETVLNGQSIGKKLMHIRVISETGNRPSFYQFLLRWLIRPFDVTSLGIGVLFLLFSPGNDAFVLLLYFLTFVAGIGLVLRKSKRLGDLAAATLVINSRVHSHIGDTVFLEVNEDYEPRFANVLQLSDRDMNIIKTILDTSLKHQNVQLAQRTSEKIKTVLKISADEPPIEFLETLLKDYNYLSNKN